MAKQRPQSKNRRAALLTRSRFSVGLLLVFAVISVVIGLQYRSSQAAGGYTLKGRVFNSATGQGMAGAKVNLCYNRFVTTDANGNWSLPNRPKNDRYCVRYEGGIPGDWIGNKAPNSRATQGVRWTYEYQFAGIDCFNNPLCPAAEQRYDLGTDENLDIGVIPRPKLGAPTAPSNFEAIPGIDEASVALIWSPSTAPAGLSIYSLERSTDEVRWSVISNGITDLIYRDELANYGVRYFYRIRALDDQGRFSGYVYANAKTAAFASNVKASDDSVLVSNDGVVTVLILAGSITVNADCSVNKTDEKLKNVKQPIVAGPYRLICRASSGREFTELNHAVTWTYHIKDQLKGFTSPKPFSISKSGKQIDTTDVLFDKANGSVLFRTTNTTTTAILGTAGTGLQLGMLLGIVVVALVGGGLAILIIKRRQSNQYTDLLSSRNYSDR